MFVARTPFVLAIAVQKLGGRLGIRGNKVTVTGPASKLTPELLEELRGTHQPQLRDLARVLEAGGKISLQPTPWFLQERRTLPRTAIFVRRTQ